MKNYIFTFKISVELLFIYFGILILFPLFDFSKVDDKRNN